MIKSSVRTAILAVTAVVSGAAFLPSQSWSQGETIVCGQDYTVVAGDSLSKIARRAYDDTNFQRIYSANSSVIGRNPEIITVGTVLQIPCLAGAAPSTADNSTIRAVQTTNALPAPTKDLIRIVVGTDWAPFTNEDQEQGGMVTEITNVALSIADGNPDYKIDFINDWGAHLQPLLTDHAYDFSLVWFRPNCDVIDKLSDDSKFRCNNLDWSDPIFEQIIGYYTHVDAPRLESHADLMGKKICRPIGYSTFMLEEKDLIEPNVVLERPRGPKECFEGLASGAYDAVVLASDTAEDAMAKLNAREQVTFHDHLSDVATMHAVIAKTNPNAANYLAYLNSGLREMKQNGDWFDVVMRHLSEHKAKTN